MANQEEKDWAALAGIVTRRGRQAVVLTLLEMPNRRPERRSRATNPIITKVNPVDKSVAFLVEPAAADRFVTNMEIFDLMEKAIVLLVMDGADEAKAHRKAAELVKEATGMGDSTIRRKHREVRDKLSQRTGMIMAVSSEWVGRLSLKLGTHRGAAICADPKAVRREKENCHICHRSLSVAIMGRQRQA